jgi:1,4-dihydroxy-2-naphthoate polyprenyltransferase
MSVQLEQRPEQSKLKAWVGAAGPPLILVIVLQAGYGLVIAGQIGDLSATRVAVTLALFFFDAIGRRLINDYEDHRRGLDTVANVRPDSTLAAGLDMRWVGRVGMTSFAIAWVLAAWLALTIEPWILLLTVACYAAYFLYAGGPRPLGHRGLGEIIDLFVTGFGVTVLVIMANVGFLNTTAAIAALGPGFMFSALMLHNNARDVDKDAAVGKTTLPQLIGLTPTKVVYCLDLAAFYVVVAWFAARLDDTVLLLPLITLPWAIRMAVMVVRANRLGDTLVSWSGLYLLMIANFGLFVVAAWP